MPGCRDKILEEITPAFNDQKELVDLDHLVNKTPLLNSIYWETMRWTSGVNSVRKVVEDTVIAGYTFLNDGVVSIFDFLSFHICLQLLSTGYDARKTKPFRP
jgi:hypothetical protein